MTTTPITLNQQIAAACVDGWYPSRTQRQAGEVYRLGGHPVAVLETRIERAPVGAPDDRDSDGEYTVCWQRLRDATEAEMAVASASRAAYKAGHGKDHPARAAAEVQRMRIAAEAAE